MYQPLKDEDSLTGEKGSSGIKCSDFERYNHTMVGQVISYIQMIIINYHDFLLSKTK